MAGAAVALDLAGEDGAAAAPQQRAHEERFVEFVGVRGRVLRVQAHTTLASALAQLRDALGPQRFARCQLCVPTVGGWHRLSSPLSFAAERLVDAPQAAAALNAPVPLPLPARVCARVVAPDRLAYVAQLAEWPGASAHRLLARLLGCDLDCTLRDALRGAAVVLLSADAAAPPLIRPPRLGAEGPVVTITVHVVTLTGKRIEAVVSADATVREVKRVVHVSQRVLPDQQRIIFRGTELLPNQALREAGVTDGATVHLVLRLCGGCGENFAMVCSPDPQEVLTWRPAAARRAPAPKQPPLVSLEVAVITTEQNPGHEHVQRAMRLWATLSDGFALRVEALPRLAWEVDAARGSAAYVWHADVLVALMVCLKRLGCPNTVAQQVARCAALPPTQWFAGGKVLRGRTMLSTRSSGRRLVGVTARFQPAEPLPAARLRVSAPERSGAGGELTWPAMAWYVHLAGESEAPPARNGSDDDDAAARGAQRGGTGSDDEEAEEAVAKATLLFWNY